jgi:hypothetical protein
MLNFPQHLVREVLSPKASQVDIPFTKTLVHLPRNPGQGYQFIRLFSQAAKAVNPDEITPRVIQVKTLG